MIKHLMKNIGKIVAVLLLAGSTTTYAQSRYQQYDSGYASQGYANGSYNRPSRIQLSYGWAGFGGSYDSGYRGDYGYRGNTYDRGYRDGRGDQRRRYRGRGYRNGRYCPTPNRYRRNRRRW